MRCNYTTYATTEVITNCIKSAVNGLAPSQIDEIEVAPPISKLIEAATAVVGPAKYVAIYRPAVKHTKPVIKLLKPLPLQIGKIKTKMNGKTAKSTAGKICITW